MSVECFVFQTITIQYKRSSFICLQKIFNYQSCIWVISYDYFHHGWKVHKIAPNVTSQINLNKKNRITKELNTFFTKISLVVKLWKTDFRNVHFLFIKLPVNVFDEIFLCGNWREKHKNNFERFQRITSLPPLFTYFNKKIGPEFFLYRMSNYNHLSYMLSHNQLLVFLVTFKTTMSNFRKNDFIRTR